MHFDIIIIIITIIIICYVLRFFFLCISSESNSVPHHSDLKFRITALVFLFVMLPVQLFFAISLYIVRVWLYLRIILSPSAKTPVATVITGTKESFIVPQFL